MRKRSEQIHNRESSATLQLTVSLLYRKRTPPKKISGGDNPYDVHDAKLSSSATAHESSSMTAHEISNTISYKRTALFLIFLKFVVFILANL